MSLPTWVPPIAKSIAIVKPKKTSCNETTFIPPCVKDINHDARVRMFKATIQVNRETKFTMTFWTFKKILNMKYYLKMGPIFLAKYLDCESIQDWGTQKECFAPKLV
jgi:hypothetical protein